MRLTGVFLAGVGVTILSISAASAADFVPAPTAAPPPPVVVEPPANFTGPYIGGIIGFGVGYKAWDDIDEGETDTDFEDAVHTVRGLLIGVEGGFRFQSSSLVFGIEGDIAFSKINGEGAGCQFEGANFDDNLCGTDIDYLATLTGQIGFVPGGMGNLLIYGEAGFAWARENFFYDYNVNDGDDTLLLTGGTRASGYVLGAGVVHAMDNGFYIKAEYNFINFGTETDILIANETAEEREFDMRQTLHVFKVGIGIQF